MPDEQNPIVDFKILGATTARNYEGRLERSAGKRKIPRRELSAFFTRYYELTTLAEREGRWPTLKEIGQPFQYFPAQVEHMILRAGLPWKRHNARLSREIIHLLKNLPRCVFSNRDLCYFLKIDSHPDNLATHRGSDKIRGTLSKHPWVHNGGERILLTYEDASRIFEYRDFPQRKGDEEINSFVREEILRRERQVYPEIIDNLKLIFPEKEIEKPYLI